MDIVKILEPWLKSIIAILIFLGLRIFFRQIIFPKLDALTQKTKTETDDTLLNAIKSPFHFFLLVLGLYIALGFSPFSDVTEHIFIKHLLNSSIIITIFWPIIVLMGNNHYLLSLILNFFDIAIEETLANILSVFVRFILVALAGSMIISEWGYDISALVAGLSIGGLALSFAAKDALSNVFGSIVIVLDKPFVKGDWINANGVEGVVEKISFRSTCLRTFPQALVYVPNSTLSMASIMNYSKRNKRRIEAVIGLTYSTTPEQMQSFVKEFKEYLLNHQEIDDLGLTLTFHDFGDSSLNVNLICYTKITDYIEFLDLKQELNFKILDLCEKIGVSVAFPSRSIYFENDLDLKNLPIKDSSCE